MLMHVDYFGVMARMFRWAKLAENAGFGYDKMLVWKHR
jgi:hypothetical protein